MGALQFDGIDDLLIFTGISAALGDVGTGAYTIAVLMSRDAWGGGSDGWDTIYVLNDTADDQFGANDSAEWQSGSFLSFQDEGNNRNWGHGLDSTNQGDPLLLVFSKAAGSAAFNASVLNISTSTWTDGTSVTSGSNATATPSTGGLIFGGFPFGGVYGDFLGGKIGVFAAWEGVAMDQTQRHECGTNLQTSDLWNHSAGQPVSLIELTSTSPTDLAGGVSSIAVNSAPTVSADDLGWIYDGVGGGESHNQATSTAVSVSTTATGGRTAQGSASTSVTTSTSAAGSKASAGSAATGITTSTDAAGNKSAHGSAAESVTSSTTAAGSKSAHDAAATSASISTTATGARPAHGAASTGVSTSTTATGSKLATGVVLTDTTVSTNAVGTKSASGSVTTSISVLTTASGHKPLAPGEARPTRTLLGVGT